MARIPRRQRRIRAVAAITLLGALAAAVHGRGAGPAPVAVFPSAGTPVASATTQISFRGAPADRLGAISVTGSRSGAHAGTLRPYSHGEGASLVLGRRFQPGEQVTVRAGVPLVGARNGAVT